jgi:hypothetical protein
MVMVMDEITKLATLGVIAKKDIKDPKLADALDHRARRKLLIRMHRGVYRLLGALDSFESRAYALTKYAGDDSAISHFGAAYLHGLEGFEEPTTLDVLVPWAVHVHPSGDCKVHRTRERFQTIKHKKLIRITSLARTLIDLSQHLDEKKLESALNAAYRIKDTIGAWLRSELKHIRSNWHGRDVLLRLVRRMGKRGLDSELELEVLRMIEKEGLPTPDHQFVICDRKREYVMRGDLGYEDEQIVLHIDSRFHQSQAAMARDAKQRSTLTDLEWTQLFVTKRTIKDRVWLEQLKRALARKKKS